MFALCNSLGRPNDAAQKRMAHEVALALLCGGPHIAIAAERHQRAARPKCGLRNRALLATPLSEGVMRPESPASAVAASTARTDAYTLRRAIGRFLSVCKAEHLPPTEILVRFDAFLDRYNARQRRLLGWSTHTAGPPFRVSGRDAINAVKRPLEGSN